MKKKKIPESTIIRLSIYSSYLTEVAHKGNITVSSSDLAKRAGISATLARKDLAYFGEFGTPGVGYNVKELYSHILTILGLHEEWSVSLVGLGNLGLALCRNISSRKPGFMITSIFDSNPAKIGKTINGITVMPVTQLEEVVGNNHTQIGIICVPGSAAQKIADMMVRSGVRAILNFAPVQINVPPDIKLRTVDLTVNLEVLTFNVGVKGLFNDNFIEA